MTAIVEEQIKNSLGDANYDRVVESLGVMRDELISYEEPALYNDLLKQLKDRLLKGELGGDRRELWWLIRRSKIGLIDRNQSDRSEVSEDEAKEVSIRVLGVYEYMLIVPVHVFEMRCLVSLVLDKEPSDSFIRIGCNLYETHMPIMILG